MQAKLRFMVQYAVLAPSTHNSQPWLFRIAGSSVFVFADRSRGIAVLDPEDRALIMSCGAALYNFTRALAAFGYTFRVSRFPDLSDPDLLARVDVNEHPEATPDTAILDVLKRRRTARDGFRGRIPDASVLQTISDRVAEQGARMVFLTREQIESLKDVVTDVPRGDIHMRRELLAWRHPNRTRTRDGVPGEPEHPDDFLTADLDAAAIGALVTPGDRMASWLHGGMGLQAGLVEGTQHGLGATLTSSPLHVPSLRSQIIDLIAPSEFVQVLVKFGVARHGRATPRRAMVDVMLHPGFSK